jgi:UPF0042 nucleotide-binding protein
MTLEPCSGGEGAARGRARLRLVIITGLSGAGHSSALKALEDLGYEAIDNLPLSMLQAAVSKEDRRPVAVGVDCRTRSFAADHFLKTLDGLQRDPALEVSLVFIDCDDDVLVRRFSETRRRHPLAEERPVADGIAHERALVAPLKARADVVVDTSTLQPADLKRVLQGHLGLDDMSGMAVFVRSFSYRRGLPREADLVFDVRFLRNPHYEAALQPLSGLDSRVAAYVEGDHDFAPFYHGLVDMLRALLPRYEREGKSYLTIAIGCTGGRHRSVAVAEKLAGWLRDEGRQVTLQHRDLGGETAHTEGRESHA